MEEEQKPSPVTQAPEAATPAPLQASVAQAAPVLAAAPAANQKISIEDDAAKIDELLSSLHEIVSREFQKGQMKSSRRTDSASRLNSTTHAEHA